MSNIQEKFDSIASQFRDLNGLHPGLWPLVPRLLTAIGLCVFVLFVGWWFYWSTQLEEIDLGQQEEQKLKEESENELRLNATKLLVAIGAPESEIKENESNINTLIPFTLKKYSAFLNVAKN